MAEQENIIFNATVKTGNSGESIKSVRAELRALTQELASLEPGSQAFTTAAQRAGVLRDQMDDAQMAIKAFNPEAKFQAFANVLGGVANGFAVAQGAMALFGTENKDIEKAILKTQAAIAIATGVNGLLGMKDSFTILASVIKTQVAGAFSTLGKAIRSSGIIALAASLAVLTYEWYKEKVATEEAAEALKKFNEYSEKSKDLTVEGMKGREKERAQIKRNMNKDLADIDEAVKQETYTIEQGEALKLQIRENASKSLAGLNDRFRKEDREKAIEAEVKKGEDLLLVAEANGVKTLNDRINRDGLELQLLKYKKDKQLITEKEFDAAVKKIETDRAAFEKHLEDEKLNARLNTYSAIGNGIKSLGELASQSGEASKELGVASATIDTYVGATKALAQGGVLGFVGAAAIVIAGLANVKRILSVKVPGSSGGGSISTPSISQAAPNIPTASNQTNLVGTNEPILTRTLNIKDQKVYVLESDIRDKTDRTNKINKLVKVK